MLEKNYHANARMATVLIGELLASFFVAGVQSSRSQREGQLVIEDPVNRGRPDTVNRTQSRRYSYKEPYSVLKRRHLATCCTAQLWVENFVGGKFRDLSMSHENNENWHPTKITRYTVDAN